MLVAVNAPLHRSDALVVSEHLRVTGNREEGLGNGFGHLVNADMALSALNFAQSDMALMRKVNPIVQAMDNFPRDFTTFGDVFLFEQLGYLTHSLIVGIFGHFGFVALNALLSLRDSSVFCMVSEGMAIYAFPTRFNMLFVVERQRLLNPILTSRNDNSQQSDEQSASDKF